MCIRNKEIAREKGFDFLSTSLRERRVYKEKRKLGRRDLIA